TASCGSRPSAKATTGTSTGSTRRRRRKEWGSPTARSSIPSANSSGRSAGSSVRRKSPDGRALTLLRVPQFPDGSGLLGPWLRPLVLRFHGKGGVRHQAQPFLGDQLAGSAAHA